jgi:hypothetical protein
MQSLELHRISGVERYKLRPLAQVLALTLNLSPNPGRGTLDILLPFAQNWEKGLGDEGILWHQHEVSSENCGTPHPACGPEVEGKVLHPD